TYNTVGWHRLPENASIFQQTADPSSGPTTAHIEIIPSNGVSKAPYPAVGSYFGIGIVLLTPTSRDSITISSANPFDPPVINLNFLTTDFDSFTMREGIRAARRFVTAPACSDYIILESATLLLMQS
ncbi:hypothetical protein BDQ12DRAFT_362679, partial [Crucibulum laeve]